MPPQTPRTPKTVDEYLARLPPESRAALVRMRKLIQTAAPRAEELISYGHPAFRQGKMRVNYAAFRDHLSFYGWMRVRDQFSEQLKPFESGKGTLMFTPDRALPSDLVKGLVTALLALDHESRPG